MEKFTAFDKLSKKKQRELNRQKRGSWNGLNPVTRKPDKPNAYKRSKARAWRDELPPLVPFALSRIVE